MNARPRLVHLTTTDISLELLLGPQLSAFVDAGYEVIGVSAPRRASARWAVLGLARQNACHPTKLRAQ